MLTLVLALVTFVLWSCSPWNIPSGIAHGETTGDRRRTGERKIDAPKLILTMCFFFSLRVSFFHGDLHGGVSYFLTPMLVSTVYDVFRWRRVLYCVVAQVSGSFFASRGHF